MSMHRDMKMEADIDEDESWLEAEVQRELDALNTGDLDDDNDSDKENIIQDTISDQDDTKENERMSEMDAYIHKMQSQTARLQQELEECDELMEHTDRIVSTPRLDQDDLVFLAKAQGMDAETLKRKVLEELDRADVEDERLMLESVNDDWDQPQEQTAITDDTKSLPDISDKGEAQTTSDTQATFLTGVGEQNMSEEEEYRQLKKTFLGPKQDELEEETVAEEKLDDEEDEGDEAEGNDALGKLTLKPGEGTLMSMVDSEALERRVMREVLDWEVKWMKTNDVKQQELAALVKEDREKLEEARRQWEERQRMVEQEQEALRQQQLAQEEKLRKEAEELQGEIEESIEQYEIEIDQLTESVRIESEALLQVKAEGQKQDEEKREKAALKIQATYRGYRVYKEEGHKLKAHLEEWKQQKTEARIKALEESRKKKEEDKRKKEDSEKRRIEAEEKRKEEEKQRKEQERIRKEEEQARKEEEKRIKAEEVKRRKKEEEQKKLEEKRLKEEEKRKKKEAELKKKEEEAKRKEEEKRRKEEEKQQQEEKLHLERLKQEQEAKRLEEEREAEAKRKQEEERKREERKREEEKRAKEEEERKRQKAEAAVKKGEEEKMKQLGIGTPRSPVPPDGKPTSPRKKMNNLRRSAMSPLANGVKSPPSSAGSQRSNSSPQSEPVQPNNSAPLLEPAPEPVSTPPDTSRLRTQGSARSDPSLTLPELMERRRLEWMEKCRPWSKTERELKIKTKPANTRKPLRRPISAKNMPELTQEDILRAAGVASLQQVTTVELHDLPGCTLKMLAGCPRLRTLRVIGCKAVTTEGLGDCKHLMYLDMQHNVLETVNLRDLDKLVYLDVSHNSLTVMQGLEGCTALRYLKAAHNRMTRISGLEGLRSLHTLDFTHNQLITTKGLSAAPTLQEVDLSHNHLPALDDLDLLGLLQVLKAAGNNIIQLPVLTNHVLLRHLVLDDNSLCSARSLSQSWLPLLRHLSMAQNSLTTLDDLSTCVTLQHLNISNNQILDVDSLLPGLKTCQHLSHLKMDGNPAREEAEIRARVLEVLPWLEKLDGQSTPSPSEPPMVTDFERMCGEQLIVWDKLTQQYQQVLGQTSQLPELASVHSRYFTTSHGVAVEQRYAHEYGESTPSSGHDSGDMTFDLTPETPGGLTENKLHSDTSQMKNKFDLALQNVNASNSGIVNGSQPSNLEAGGTAKLDSVRASKTEKSLIRPSAVGKGLRQPARSGNAIQNAAATCIQALWRGYQVRRDIDFHSRLWMAATSIQALWRGYFTRKVLQEMGYFVGALRDEALHRAATIIQAAWRGHRVRKRIRYALSYARMSFDEDDLDEDLDFTEVDLSAFDFNEADLDKGWTPPETPQLPANHAVIGKPSASSQKQAADAKAAFDAAFNTPQQPFPLVKRPPHPPQQPRQAWRNVDSPLSDVPPGGRPPLPPLSRLSDHTGTESHTTARTYRSKKEEQLTEEWGFKDSRTAELMMQRAKKLKHNAARKKKISQLDPKQRLALFRKLEETTNVRPVQPPVKKILPRKEYFQAREEEVTQKAVEKQRDQVNHHMRTYEWLHTQVGNYPAPASSRINQGLSEGGQYNSEGNLPQMDAHVIAGARPNLTGSPMLLELQSLDSVSTAGDLQRRMSSGGDPASRLPPIKVSSAPSAQVHERMSFRNPKPKPTIESVGWGGGRKRSNRR